MEEATGRTRTETDTFGPIQVPAERLWGAQTQRSLEHFRISGERMPLALVHALVLRQEGGGPRPRRARRARRREGRGHRRRRGRGARRAVGRRVPARGLADGERHPDQHERQRGPREPRERDPRRGARREAPRAPERRRQPGPVHERRVPHRDPRGDGRGLPPGRHPRGLAPPRHPRRQGGGVPRRRQGRPHAPHGRDAHHPGPGDLGLGGAAGLRGRAPRAGAAPPPRAGPRGDRGRHRPQRPPRARGPRGGEARREDRPPVRDRAEQVRGARLPGRARLRARRPPGGGGLALQDRERRAVAGLRPPQRPRRDRDPRERAGQLDHAGQGQPDAVAPRTSRAARSCRARSTRRSPRRSPWPPPR